MHVCGTDGTVIIWWYGHLLCSASLLALCVLFTNENITVNPVHLQPHTNSLTVIPPPEVTQLAYYPNIDCPSRQVKASDTTA